MSGHNETNRGPVFLLRVAGGVPALLIVAIVLALLMRRAETPRSMTSAPHTP